MTIHLNSSLSPAPLSRPYIHSPFQTICQEYGIPYKKGAMSAYASALVCNAQGRYNCPHCDSHFSREDGALRHIENSCPSLFPEKKVPPKEGDYKRNARGRYNCPHCDVDFASSGNVTQHLKKERCTVLFSEEKAKTKKKKAPPKESEYTRNARGRYNCPHCDVDFASSGNVTQHLKKERCTVLFPEKKAKTKKKKAPPKEGEYTRNARGRYNCPHCEAHFSRGQGVFRHVKNS